MPAITYREHLALFNKYKTAQIHYGKILSALALTLILTLTATLKLTSVNNQEVIPVNDQSAYFESASGSFYKSKQLISELKSSFQVAGAKTQKVDSLKEASATSRVPGFFITLGDVQKNIDQIENVRENIEKEHKNLQNSTSPALYQTLNAQISEYMIQTQDLLDRMQRTQSELKDLHAAATPAFFLPTLSDEHIWQSGEIDEIKNYYKKRKEEAVVTQESFAKVKASQELLDYKTLQDSYFTLVINVSDNIIGVLDRPIEDTEDAKASLKEEAYQVLVGAQRENELIAEQLASKRVELTSMANYEEVLASLSNKERIIESGLAQGNQVQHTATNKLKENASVLSNFDFSAFTK